MSLPGVPNSCSHCGKKFDPPPGHPFFGAELVGAAEWWCMTCSNAKWDAEEALVALGVEEPDPELLEAMTGVCTGLD